MLLQLSIRNLLRHRRRNGLLLAVIVIAVAGVVLTNALIRGFQHDMADSAVANLTGHLSIVAPGYFDDPNIAHSFELTQELQQSLDQLSARSGLVMGWTARVRVPAVIMSERETRGITLVGVAQEEESISFLGEVSTAGAALGGADERGILIGAALAEQLETAIGRRLVLMSQGYDGSNQEAGYRIVGTFDAEGSGLEKQFAFTGRETLQKMLGTANVTEASVRMRREPDDGRILSELAANNPNLAVHSWQELQPQAAVMFEFADLIILIWFLIMMGALSFGLINTLVTAVMERIRELGLLRALGMQAGSVVQQVVIESMLLMLAGLVLGIGFGALLVYWLGDGIDLSRWAQGMEMAGMRSVLRPVLETKDLLLVAVLSLVLGLLASLYPARKAVNIEPLEALGR
ncbi:MAG: ABC transporter permease [Pseudomonadales bacterium]